MLSHKYNSDAIIIHVVILDIKDFLLVIGLAAGYVWGARAKQCLSLPSGRH